MSLETQEAPPVAPGDDGFGPTSDNGTSTAQEVLAVRWKLVCAGYTPVPNHGKRPPVKDWQNLQGVTHEQLRMWGLSWPDATNTGVLTRTVPTFDVDILNEDAARAVDDMVREHCEETGRLLMRIGRPPKRAFLFRTDAPFKKIEVLFVGTEEKLEFLGDGQQVVVNGIHPDTHKPYSWFGGEPVEVAWKDLPVITEDEARELIERAVDLLKEFGYVRTAERQRRCWKGARRRRCGLAFSHRAYSCRRSASRLASKPRRQADRLRHEARRRRQLPARFDGEIKRPPR